MNNTREDLVLHNVQYLINWTTACVLVLLRWVRFGVYKLQ
jgi:hypothetical protein